MVIFRIENEQKLGPYYATYDSKWQTKDHGESKKTPGPSADKIQNTNKPLNSILKNSHLFGFKSLEQLKKWFSKKELKNLHNKGFLLAEIQCATKYIRLGGKQLVFKDIDTTRTHIPLSTII